MTLSEIIAEIAETLRNLPDLLGIPVIEEDKGNVFQKVDTAIAQQCCCLVVGLGSFSPTIQGDTAPNGLVGSASFVVSIFENPLVHRNCSPNIHLIDIAALVANTLNSTSAPGMTSALYFKGVSEITELGKPGASVVSCDVSFETKTCL